jgi:hypothetical protein
MRRRRVLVRYIYSFAAIAAPQRLGRTTLTRSEREKLTATFNVGSEVPAELNTSEDGIVAIALHRDPYHLADRQAQGAFGELVRPA